MTQLRRLAEAATTTSRVLLTGSAAQVERDMMRKWCDWAASNGGSFAIKQEWAESQWWTTYTINWPAALDGSES